MAIACIGAAHIDRKARALDSIVLGSSNPVRFATGHGGVARNVAENLAHLGCPVWMASCVGDDADGEAVVAALKALNVDTSAVRSLPGERTATYTALLDPRGELVVALADMGIYDQLTPELLQPFADALKERTIWFVDANLPASTLHWLADLKPTGTRLAVDAVSVAKSRRIAPILPKLDLLFVNRDEASSLSGIPIRAPLDVLAAGDRLRERGAGAVVVTTGSDGLFVASTDEFSFHEALPAAVRDVTGAGDALVAGILYGFHQEMPLAESVGLGLAAATLTVEATESVRHDLDAAMLARRAPRPTA